MQDYLKLNGKCKNNGDERLVVLIMVPTLFLMLSLFGASATYLWETPTPNEVQLELHFSDAVIDDMNTPKEIKDDPDLLKCILEEHLAAVGNRLPEAGSIVWLSHARSSHDRNQRTYGPFWVQSHQAKGLDCVDGVGAYYYVRFDDIDWNKTRVSNRWTTSLEKENQNGK